jgi:uncharacterized protein YihD (DUF1040 family)
MRDPKRISPIVDMIKAYWTSQPDLRFFQVVEIIKSKLSKSKDHFFTEDEKVQEVLANLMENQINY